jgi:hypothetical protein
MPLHGRHPKFELPITASAAFGAQYATYLDLASGLVKLKRPVAGLNHGNEGPQADPNGTMRWQIVQLSLARR